MRSIDPQPGHAVTAASGDAGDDRWAEHAGPRLSLLGAFDLQVDGVPVPLPMPAQRLLALLALQGRPALRVYVAGMLWLDASEVRSLGSLRSALWRLREVSDRLVEATGQQLRLAREVSVDVRDGVAWGRGVLAGTVVSPEGLDEAFVSGEILPDWYDDWLLIERERFRQLRAHALERLCERLTADGRFGEAMEAGLAAVKDEPLRESAHRAVIRVCLAEGNRADAVRQYRLFSRLLREQLDVPPSSQLEDLLRPVMAG